MIDGWRSELGRAIEQAVTAGHLSPTTRIDELIFNINGVGGTLYRAIIQGEGPTVVAFTTVLIIVFIVSNLLVDLLYAALDPRIRYA